MSDDLRPDEWANIVHAKVAEAIHGLPISESDKWTVRMMVAATMPAAWKPYALEFRGERNPLCGCPINDDGYAPHPGEPCDWSHWHPNYHSEQPREDRFCWKCGSMETQELGL
jgi:hypothetical protein